MPDLHHLVRIAAPVTRVNPLVCTGKGFRKWWAEDVESAPDGVVTLGFFDRSTVYVLRPIGQATVSRAEWRCESGDEWSGTRLLFELERQANETVVRFTHADWKAATDYFVSCNTTWGRLMFLLKAAAEEQSSDPLFRRNGMGY